MQEALTNVVRHAGTGHCAVRVDYGDEELSVEVLDEGCGAPGDAPAHRRWPRPVPSLRLLTKLGARYRVQLVITAYETGLVAPPP